MKTTPIAKPSLTRHAAEATPILQTQDGMPGATVLPPSRRQAHCATMQLLADRSRRQQSAVQCMQSASASTDQASPPERRMQSKAAKELAKHMRAVANVKGDASGSEMEKGCKKVQAWLRERVGDFDDSELRSCQATVDLIVGALTGKAVGREDFMANLEKHEFNHAELTALSEGIHIIRSNNNGDEGVDHQFAVVARDQVFDLYESNAYGDRELACTSLLPWHNVPHERYKNDAERLKREQHSHTKVGMNTEALQQQLLAIHAVMKGQKNFKKGFNHWERYHIPPSESGGKCAIL
ncbi:hypothetical protein [Chitinimonas taiwanensis]|uniref:hypothetical protein n=1 Tax=Chitinimonas taiwanensis TaxID=240412 RepID=UPI0035AFD90A